ncbi:MAG TPA: xanthine dehydrogenase family protein molybdopterin-binding subunit [Edaphobacter sp.]|uniref:xanthine dehydrogenase family protein molybdopterin-binding subunit n=1 Tax=Edaphobacter sp. TaxID=1934404 RepID=UPI002C7C3AF5|nr:xanthine dehydrogenase family protein molybdopterin-binding subunit [Edaphobacter sp.]HUZ93499.1 xanthine dehydrogenase family protein molybdopterin-binding subunit [Edaphobacter sp.]
MMAIESEQQQEQKPERQLDHRYDAFAKVTGRAKYAAEFPVKNVAYAYIVQATIPAGSVASIDDTAASRASGVHNVLTPFNAPKLAELGNVNVLQDATVFYSGQPIAVVVARSLPEARSAAALLHITYKEQPAKLDFNNLLGDARPPKRGGTSRRGDPAASLAKATVTVDQTYSTPLQNHNPMEPHATIAAWDGDKLNVYDSTQGITGVQQGLARAFSIPQANVHVDCPYTGGGFGCKGYVWSQTILAAMAAKVAQRPVKLVLDRGQMFGPVGSRPNTSQHIKLAASADGKLLLQQHDSTCYTSFISDWVESAAAQTTLLYDSESLSTTHLVVPLNLGMGTWMRAPGESTGSVGLEIALDELAEKLNIDPVQLRLINYAEKDPRNGKPWSSKHLREAYAQASERFGWSKRSAQPGQHREGNKLIGYGMATANYGAGRSPSSAVVRILPSGRVFVGIGTQDIGTGTYTILAQTAALALAMDPSHVDVKLGDTNLPRSGGSGGSTTAASVCPAVYDAAAQARLKLAQLAIGDAQSPLHGAAAEDFDTKDGKVFLKSAPDKSEAIIALLARNGGAPVEATATSELSKDRDTFTSHSWGAVFAEVAVDADTHMVQVRRLVATYDIGTLLNDKTGLNQLTGGLVWGISMALHEEAVIDKKYGRTVNENFAEYHVPVNADVHEIDVTCLNIPDYKFNPLGARGIGEIGITGTAAAIANAIYNATGKRVRDLPITLDKLMA